MTTDAETTTTTAIQRVIDSDRPANSNAIALPNPRMPIEIRVAEQSDLAFIDQLQKEHSKMVGWFPTTQLETNITKGKVLVADSGSERVGYCISSDRYFKHDDVGIIYQLNVKPTRQRGLIGATLVKSVFERAAYGCKLFCCWCAQDLDANYFWESIGFVPLAFRTGSRRNGRKDAEPRMHIFWEKRIREGDVETPYWFPSETAGGAMRENRIALPIPPGTHWSDAKPAVLPGIARLDASANEQRMLEQNEPRMSVSGSDDGNTKASLPDGRGSSGDTNPNTTLPDGRGSSGEAPKRTRSSRTKKKAKGPSLPTRPKGGLWFAPPEEQLSAAEKKQARAEARKLKNKETKRMKYNPKWLAAARELRDRYIEELHEGRLLPPSACGKYDVSRQLEGAPSAMSGEAMKNVNVEQVMLDGDDGRSPSDQPGRLLDAA